MPILTGFGPYPRGPKSGQEKLADLDALVRFDHDASTPSISDVLWCLTQAMNTQAGQSDDEEA